MISRGLFQLHLFCDSVWQSLHMRVFKGNFYLLTNSAVSLTSVTLLFGLGAFLNLLHVYVCIFQVLWRKKKKCHYIAWVTWLKKNPNKIAWAMVGGEHVELFCTWYIPCYTLRQLISVDILCLTSYTCFPWMGYCCQSQKPPEDLVE